MAKQVINNSEAFSVVRGKLNSNFDELYMLGSNSLVHPSSPGATLPATANFVGELFVKTGNSSVKKGVYSALDLVGNWTGPLVS